MPQVLLMENVTQIHSKKNIEDFKKWTNFLESLGYSNYYQDLNAKNYGIPQNRDRTFMVSLLGNYYYEFPKPFKLELRLKDMLEDEVDEKYYLSDKMIEYIVANNEKWTGNNNKSLVNKSIASTINTGEGTRRYDASNYIVEGLPEDTDIKLMQVGQMYGTEKEPNPQDGRVYDPNGLSPTMDTCSGGKRMPKIIVAGKTNYGGQRSLILDEEDICNCLSATDYKQPKQIIIREVTKKGYAVAEEGDGIYINRPHQKRGVVQKGMSQTIKCNPNDLGVVVNATHRDKISLKRGYNVEVKKESPDTTEIDVIGNYSKSNYNVTQIVGKNGIAPTVRENHGQVTAITTATRDNLVVINTLWTKTQAKMINADGNVKRYIDSNIIDEFKEGQVADISSPNGYNKGPRVHNECPTINGTTTASSFIVKVNDKEDKKISLNTNYKKLIDTIENNVLPIGEVKHMDLYNRNLTDNCGTLNNPCHNNNRLWDGLRIRKLTPRECFRLMGIKDESFDKIKNLSNTQAYKQAGNGIVVNVLMEIFKKLIN